MMARKTIELVIKLFIVALTFSAIFWVFKVLDQMGLS